MKDDKPVMKPDKPLHTLARPMSAGYVNVNELTDVVQCDALSDVTDPTVMSLKKPCGASYALGAYVLCPKGMYAGCRYRQGTVNAMPGAYMKHK